MSDKIIGIYKITCVINNRIYVGSSINLIKRIIYHKSMLKRNRHDNDYLQKAYDKYGIDNFTFEMIEECKRDVIYEREQYWMDFYNSCIREFGFNIMDKAAGTTYSVESRRRMSEAKKGKRSPHLIGYKHSDETKEVIRQKRLKQKDPRLGVKCSEEQIERMRLLNTKPVLQYDKEWNFIQEWISLSAAARGVGSFKGNVRICCNDKNKTTQGFHFKYKNENNG